VSGKIDMLEPDGGEPLPDWLSSSALRSAVRDFVQARRVHGADEAVVVDIVRQAEQAIAGVPLGAASGADWSRHAAAARSRVVACIGVSASVVRQGLRATRGAIAARAPMAFVRRFGAELRQRLRRDWDSALRSRFLSMGAHSKVKLYAALGAAALGSSLVLLYLPGRLGSTASQAPDFPGPQVWQARAPATAPAVEERPAEGRGVEFSRANIRYCTFQQIRLEALGPVTEGADLVVFNALVADWNARCTRYRYHPADKDAIDGEAGARRALLEVEGRALMNGWRRKIVTTVQQRPATPGLGAEENPALVHEETDVSAVRGAASDAVERLPLLITQGRTASDEPDRDTGLSLRAPALALLRADVALRVQRRLNDLGYTINPIDGTWGTMSRNALRRFKRANGLLGNDAFDAETVTRLFSTSAVTAAALGQEDDEATIETAYPPPPAAGMNPLNRADGQRIQQRLTELGYYTAHGDGAWGIASRSALRNFKVANGLSDDDEWNAMAETVLFDEQAVRAADAPVGSARSPAPSPVVAVPLPPKRPPPPAAAKAAELPSALAPRDAPRPPALIPTPPGRAPGAASRPSP
jgi:peptidoglycan hydrolase-like protein with peptidoglycan-binding domain